MALFGNLTTDGLEQAQDRLGGFQVLDSGVYTGKIKAIYAGKADRSNAQNVTLILDIPGQAEYRETFWITNKNGENWFAAKDKSGQATGKKSPLPGFTVVNDLCLVTTGKPLAQQAHEEKILNIWDFEARRELPKSVPVLVELLGQEVSLGIMKQLENKTVQQGNEYVPTAETREVNYTDKVFHFPSNVTVAEAEKAQTDGVEPKAVFHDAWKEKNTGTVRDKREIKDGQSAQGGKAGRPGAAPQAGAQSAPAKTASLFGNKG
jgi:hypothetical protein